jgi:DNA-binding NarL/FixJ family response regulator
VIRVIVADDHALVRAGLVSLLRGMPDVDVVGQAANGREAVTLAARQRPHVVFMDIAMPDLNGLDACARLARETPSARVIMLSMHANEEYLRQALRAGARGYLLKGASPAELEVALNAVARGETYITPPMSAALVEAYRRGGDDGSGGVSTVETLTSRQREVLQLIAEGHSSKAIAQRLNLSVKTIETHRSQLMARLDIHDIAGLVRYAVRHGLVSPER